MTNGQNPEDLKKAGGDTPAPGIKPGSSDVKKAEGELSPEYLKKIEGKSPEEIVKMLQDRDKTIGRQGAEIKTKSDLIEGFGPMAEELKYMMEAKKREAEMALRQPDINYENMDDETVKAVKPLADKIMQLEAMVGTLQTQTDRALMPEMETLQDELKAVDEEIRSGKLTPQMAKLQLAKFRKTQAQIEKVKQEAYEKGLKDQKGKAPVTLGGSHSDMETGVTGKAKTEDEQSDEELKQKIADADPSKLLRDVFKPKK